MIRSFLLLSAPSCSFLLRSFLPLPAPSCICLVSKRGCRRPCWPTRPSRTERQPPRPRIPRALVPPHSTSPRRSASCTPPREELNRPASAVPRRAPPNARGRLWHCPRPRPAAGRLSRWREGARARGAAPKVTRALAGRVREELAARRIPFVDAAAGLFMLLDLRHALQACTQTAVGGGGSARARARVLWRGAGVGAAAASSSEQRRARLTLTRPRTGAIVGGGGGAVAAHSQARSGYAPALAGAALLLCAGAHAHARGRGARALPLTAAAPVPGEFNARARDALHSPRLVPPVLRVAGGRHRRRGRPAACALPRARWGRARRRPAPGRAHAPNGGGHALACRVSRGTQAGRAPAGCDRARRLGRPIQRERCIQMYSGGTPAHVAGFTGPRGSAPAPRAPRGPG